MKNLYNLLITLFAFTSSLGTTLNGLYTVGAGGNFSKLYLAANALASDTVTGNVIFELQSTYNGTTGELFPITFPQFKTSGGNWTVTVRPASGVTMVITAGAPASGVNFIHFNGGDRFILDGRAGGTGSNIAWTIRSTMIANHTPAILFSNDATYDTVRYVQIESQNRNAGSGTVVIGGTSGTTGNDHLFIGNCNIRDRSDNNVSPYNAIYSIGTSGIENDSNTISNNNIFNFNGGIINNGIYIRRRGSGTQWTISGNSFFQTSVTAVASTVACISFGSGLVGAVNTISGNYIGGRSPHCGGAQWDFANGGTWQGITAIDSLSGRLTVTNNEIRNISLKEGTGGFAQFFGIIFGGPSIVYIGTNANTGNIIGDTMAVANITNASGSSFTYGITETGASYVSQISYNKVVNITNTATSGNFGAVIGIRSTGIGTCTIADNTIYNLSTSTGYAYNISSPLTSNVMGMWIEGNKNVAGNTIYNLSENHPVDSAGIVGIFYRPTGPGNRLERNFLHSFKITATVNSGITGISIAGSGVTTSTISNNMIRLGIDGNGNPLSDAVYIAGIEKDISTPQNFYYNSVYIGGSGVIAGTNSTSAFLRYSSSAGADDLRNNIFMNERSNASTGGKHYAMQLNSTNSLISDHNVLYATGSGGMLVSSASIDYSTLAGWQAASSLDSNSVSADPAFKAATASVSAVDLHIEPSVASAAESRATQISINNDYDLGGSRNGPYPLFGQANGGGSSPDAGADEGDFTPLVVGIKNNSKENTLIIFPNPATQYLLVRTNHFTEIAIYDVLGEKVYPPKDGSAVADSQTGIKNHPDRIGTEIRIDVSNLATGIYFLQLETEGSRIVNKFLKQ